MPRARLSAGGTETSGRVLGANDANRAGVTLESATYRPGRPLKFHPQKEKFIGTPEADKLLTREYRKPFVVPKEV